MSVNQFVSSQLTDSDVEI